MNGIENIPKAETSVMFCELQEVFHTSGDTLDRVGVEELRLMVEKYQDEWMDEVKMLGGEWSPKYAGTDVPVLPECFIVTEGLRMFVSGVGYNSEAYVETAGMKFYTDDRQPRDDWRLLLQDMWAAYDYRITDGDLRLLVRRECVLHAVGQECTRELIEDTQACACA